MKGVLLSIGPKRCELIASGEATVEVRKTKPKLEVPFKVYIYCTKGKFEPHEHLRNNLHYDDSTITVCEGRGNVIGEFICNEITVAECGSYYKIPLKQAQLDALGLMFYANEKTVYGWHISTLIIYDKPKELSLFHIVDYEAVRRCEYRERIYNNPDFTNNALLPGGYVCNKCELDWCIKCKTKPLTHPPQSYCYVEGLLSDGF